MYIRLKSAEIRWLTATVYKLRSGLQTLLLTARPGLTGGRRREVQLKSGQSCVNTERCPTATTLRSSERTSSQLAEHPGQNLNSTPGGSLPSSTSLYSWRAQVFLKLLAAFPLLHFPPSHLVPHTNSTLGIIIISCVLSLSFLLFSMFP